MFKSAIESERSATHTRLFASVHLIQICPDDQQGLSTTEPFDLDSAWAQNEHDIDWIDLSVLSANAGAQQLYEAHGFQVVGRTADRFRVNGQSVDEIELTLNVAQI